MARSVFSCLNDDFTLSVMWTSNASKTSRLLLLPRPPIRARHTFSIQIFIWSESIQPFSLAETTTPCLLLIFGAVFHLQMTIRFSLEPSPQQANTTVTLFFSFPVERIFTVFSPVWWHIKCKRRFIHVRYEVQWIVVFLMVMNDEPMKSDDFSLIIVGESLCQSSFLSKRQTVSL